MPRLLLFAPCQTALIDAASGNLSLINVVQSVRVPTTPIPLLPVTLVALWRRSEEEVDAAMTQLVIVRGPDNNEIGRVETQFIFQRLGHRIINKVGGFQIPHQGNYEFQLYITRQGAEYPEQPASSFPLLIQQATPVVAPHT